MASYIWCHHLPYIVITIHYISHLTRHVVLSLQVMTCMYIYDSIHWKRYNPELHQIQKPKFLGTSSNSDKISIWICTARYREIWVSGFGGYVWHVVIGCHWGLWTTWCAYAVCCAIYGHLHSIWHFAFITHVMKRDMFTLYDTLHSSLFMMERDMFILYDTLHSSLMSWMQCVI